MRQTIAAHPSVVAFMDEVCAKVKAKEMHEDIKQEMLSHLEERIAELKERSDRTEDSNWSEDSNRSGDKAVAEALRHLGDPALIGQGFHLAHRPRPEWSIMALMAGMIAIAIVALLTLQVSLSDRYSMLPKAIGGLAGIAGMIALYYADYRKLVPLSKYLYGATILTMAAAHWWGPTINGSNYWLQVGPVGFNIYAASPYLLVAALAGILGGTKKNTAGQGGAAMQERARAIGWGRWLGHMREWAVCLLLPGYFFVQANALVPLLIYGTGLAALLLVSGRLRLLLAVAGSAAAAGMLLRLQEHRYAHVLERLTGFRRLESDSGYATKQSIEALQAGGLWGQGWGIPSSEFTMPYFESEMLFSYMVHSLGWVFGAAVVVVVLLFLARIVRAGAVLRDEYARRLTVGLTTLLVVKFVWNLAMCFGWLPIAGMELPFIYWSSVSVIEFMAVGLMLAAYRRKDMISRPGLLKQGVPASK